MAASCPGMGSPHTKLCMVLPLTLHHTSLHPGMWSSHLRCTLPQPDYPPPSLQKNKSKKQVSVLTIRPDVELKDSGI